MGASFYKQKKISHVGHSLPGDNCSEENEIKVFLGLNEKDDFQQLMRNNTKKMYLLSESESFDVVDLHARNASTESTKNIEQLLNYLMSSCNTSLNTVRTLYIWILTHIRFNNATLCSVDVTKTNPLNILYHQQGTQQEINFLFHYLCQQLSIPCVLVHGLVKSVKLVLDSGNRKAHLTNHIWSLVLVQNQWRFVDCAGGGGHLDPDDVDRVEVLEFYFLTDPEDYIRIHYPLRISDTKLCETNVNQNSEHLSFPVQAQETLQMLEKPVSLQDFSQQPVMSAFSVSHKIMPLSHTSYQVNIYTSELFEVEAQQCENMSARLVDISSGSAYPHCVLVTRSGLCRYRIFVKPKCLGEHKLIIFGSKQGSAENKLKTAIVYHLNVENVEPKFVPMPALFGVWGANSKTLQFGFTKAIFNVDVLTCRSGEVHIKLPTSRFVLTKSVLSTPCECTESEALSPSSQSTLNQYAEGIVHIRARLPQKGFYSLILQAQKHKNESNIKGNAYVDVAYFFINCLNQSLSNACYPRCYPVAQCYQTLLLEPLKGELVLKEIVLIRLWSTLLTRVKVENIAMKKEDNNDNNEETKGNIWSVKYTPDCPAMSVYIYGTTGEGDSLHALYKFTVVTDNVVTVSTHL